MSLLQRVEEARNRRTGQDGTDAATPGQPFSPSTSPAPPVPKAPAKSAREEAIEALYAQLSDEVVSAWASLIDLSNPEAVRTKLKDIVDEFVDGYATTNGIRLTNVERAKVTENVIQDVTGFGPIDPLLADSSITEVMVNGPRRVYVERAGKIEKAGVTFRDDEHVMNVIDRIITPIGRRIDETSPRVDARLPDGSRVNAIIKPLSLVGPVVTIRKFATRYGIEDLINLGTATEDMFEFLRACVEARLNVFLSGSTGSGKTTTLNVISSFIPENERIITIEDSAELLLDQTHVVTLESRPSNLEGKGEITIRDLLRNALHMRPDRIIVGECRAGEALDMIQAMTTGQEGSLSTGHANTPRDMLRRLETMVLMTGYELPLRAIREQIASAVDLVVHTARLQDGSRKIVSITEVYGIEGDDILTQEIFTFQQTGVDANGAIQGRLQPTGKRPTFMESFKVRGIQLPPGDFGIPPEDPSKPQAVSRKSRWGSVDGKRQRDPSKPIVGLGRAVTAGGMVYVSAVGPVDPKTGDLAGIDIKSQTRQCLQNLKDRLAEQGATPEDIVWANWSLRERSEYDMFQEVWAEWFPSDAPVGQETLMTPAHRREDFRITIGVIAAPGSVTGSSSTAEIQVTPSADSTNGMPHPGAAAASASAQQPEPQGPDAEKDATDEPPAGPIPTAPTYPAPPASEPESWSMPDDEDWAMKPPVPLPETSSERAAAGRDDEVA